MANTLHNFAGILFDVDMTLTTTKREVSPRLQEALQTLGRTSLKLGVCTGRAYVALKQTIFPLFKPDSLHITAGGSQVISGAGEVIWQKLLTEETCHILHELGAKYQQMYYLPTDEYGYGSKTFIEKYQSLHNLIPPLRPISELKQWTTPHMVFVNVSPDFLHLLEQRTDITLRTSQGSPNFVSVDVTPRGITKAQGVEQWCLAQGISPQQVIGLGDGNNDIEFLRQIGHAVVMGNGTAEIKAIADRIIGHTDEDGLAVYLETIVKGSPV